MIKGILILSIFLGMLNIQAKELVRIGHMLDTSLDVSPKDMKVSLRLWITEIGKSTGLEFEPQFYNSIKELKEDMDQGNIDYIIVRALDVVEEFDINDLIEGYSPVRANNSIHNTLSLVVPKKSNYQTLRDLKDKHIGLYEGSEAEEIFINSLLLEKELPVYTKYFSKLTYYKKRSRALLDLYFKKVDAVIVTKGTIDLASELNPQIGKSIQVIHQKQLHLGMVGFFSNKVDKTVVNKFYNGLINMTDNKRTQQVLTLFKSDRLEKTDKTKLLKLQQYYQDYLNLQKVTLK